MFCKKPSLPQYTIPVFADKGSGVALPLRYPLSKEFAEAENEGCKGLSGNDSIVETRVSDIVLWVSMNENLSESISMVCGKFSGADGAV